MKRNKSPLPESLMVLVCAVMTAALLVHGAVTVKSLAGNGDTAKGDKSDIVVDVGNHNDYGGGSYGGSFGGSDYDYGSSSSSGGWSYSYDDDDDDDYYSGSTHSSHSSSGGSSEKITWVDIASTLFALAVLAFVMYRYNKGWFGKRDNSNPYGKQIPFGTMGGTNYESGIRSMLAKEATSRNVSLVHVKSHDPGFNTENFLEYAKDVFMKLNMAWANRDLEPVRHLEAPELFNEHNQQMDEYRYLHRINVIDDIKLMFAGIEDYKVEADKEIITVKIIARLKDYIKDDRNGNIQKGNETDHYWMRYMLKFGRTYSYTNDGQGENEQSVIMGNNGVMMCPNCGAEIGNVGTVSKCPYCNSILRSAGKWELVGYDGDNLLQEPASWNIDISKF